SSASHHVSGKQQEHQRWMRDEESKDGDSKDEKKNRLKQRYRPVFILILTAATVGLSGQWAFTDGLRNGFHTSGNGSPSVTRRELWCDDPADDAGCDDVGNRTFKTVPHFKTELAVSRKNNQSNAVVFALSPDAPLFNSFGGPVLDGLIAQGLTDPYNQL